MALPSSRRISNGKLRIASVENRRFQQNRMSRIWDILSRTENYRLVEFRTSQQALDMLKELSARSSA